MSDSVTKANRTPKPKTEPIKDEPDEPKQLVKIPPKPRGKKNQVTDEAPQAPKKKRQPSAKQLENLKKGQEKLAEIRKQKNATKQ